jgi:hypothetical protein
MAAPARAKVVEEICMGNSNIAEPKHHERFCVRPSDPLLTGLDQLEVCERRLQGTGRHAAAPPPPPVGE